MLYFTNQELAETNHVSVRTVRNWIDSSREGKVDLTLHTKGERDYIANTSKNTLIIKDLVSKNKKYRPHRAFKILSPRPEFYEQYTPEQIYDIVSSLEIHHELPQQYNYFNDGAHAWDKYAQHMDEEESLNTLKASKKLFESNISYFDSLLSTYKKVNIIDLGVGNVLPVKEFLQHFIDNGKLGRYIAIDISPEMLAIAKQNVSEWYGKSVGFEGFELDMTQSRFTKILAQEYTKKTSKDTANLLLLLGGTLSNFRAPGAVLRNIYDSMGINDFLIYEKKLDSPSTRRFFDFNTSTDELTLPPIFGYLVNQLNIDRSLYDLDLGYSEERKERYERIRLKMAITLRFEFEDGERLIDFNKGDAVLVWRSRQQTALDVINQFDQNDFYPIHTSQTPDQEYMITVSRIKHD